MPQTVTLTADNQSFTVPEDVAQIEIRMWGGGGSGERVDPNTLVKTSGNPGGFSELLGLRAGGGGAGDTPGGGARGSGSTTFDWASLGVSVNTYNGSNGTIPTRGQGALIGSSRFGNGANGDPGNTTYSSFVQHVFNNDSNTNIITNSSSDLSVSFENLSAPDGLSCSPNIGTKHYRISFNQAFTNSSYTLNLFGICQQAAGGGTNSPYYSGGIDYKTASGFRVWFCNGNAKNTFVRCFQFTCVGQKAGAQGQGGGGGGGASATLTRQNLIDSGIFAPGTNLTARVGQGGTGGYATGDNGRISLTLLIVPTVVLTSNRVELILGGNPNNATLNWFTTGDADSVVWLSGNINNNLLTSQENVSPQITTTYTIQATGQGGTSAPASVTIFVFYPPTASIETPETINYGDPMIVSFTTQYADTTVKLTPFYYYTDGTSSVGDEIVYTPAITAESGRLDSETIVSDASCVVPVPWGTTGPESISVQITAEGRGGIAYDSGSTTVIIDRMPDNVNIPETDGLFKDEDPVFTPETDILTDLILIDGIDIPVEIKADYPIKVDINQSGVWQDVEQI